MTMSSVENNENVMSSSNNFTNDAECTTNFHNHEDNADAINDVSKKSSKKRILQFSDSDSEEDKENVSLNDNLKISNVSHASVVSSDSDDNQSNQLELKNKRIRTVSASNSDSLTEEVSNTSRIKLKKSKLKSKFQSLLKSRARQPTLENSNITLDQHESDSNEESNSIESVKQKIKKKLPMSSICDPDTSDEEASESDIVKNPQRKSIKHIPPKPMRMSAKQAMENMQKIKSESNRMLREKEVSLPYHRPKAISLKDIMSRRRPAVNADGKALPIKMNNDQLKQFALQLEQRQKEMMELCKSDTEEDNEDIPNENAENIQLDCNFKQDIQMTDSKFNSDNAYNEVIACNPKSVIPKNMDSTAAENVKDINKDDKNNDTENYLLSDKNETNCTKMLTENNILPDEPLNAEKNSNDMMPGINNCNTEPDSQLISLQHDSEKNEINPVSYNASNNVKESLVNKSEETTFEVKQNNPENLEHDDPYSDTDMEDIDKMIENADIIKNKDRQIDVVNSPMLIIDQAPLNKNPKLAGVPGMVIDLDGNSQMTRKLSGVELLKERFVYFSNLKTPEEIEKEKEKRIKPGVLHLKLKQELEQQIEEQRCLEWEKRLEEEKLLQDEVNKDELLEKSEDLLEKKFCSDEENNLKDGENSEDTSEEDLIEDDVFIDDKPNKKNPLIDDEAEESDDEVTNDNDNGEVSTEDEESESSDSEEENNDIHKKGRILKAFEDSEDEDEQNKAHDVSNKQEDIQNSEKNFMESQISQDEDLQLAQRRVYSSEDLFTSQESRINDKQEFALEKGDATVGTQTFSLLTEEFVKVPESSQESRPVDLNIPDSLSIIFDSQNTNKTSKAVMLKHSDICSQNLASSQLSQYENKDIGDDVLALCTGKFYDNEFISQTEDDRYLTNDVTQETASEEVNIDNNEILQVEESTKPEDNNILKEVLDELNDEKFNPTNPKFFSSNINEENNLQKKKLIIDSDDDSNKEVSDVKKKKKLKKKKLEDRALVFSDDEEDGDLLDDYEEDELSDTEDPNRIIEYDSEENEVVVLPEKVKTKKGRKMTEFFEQEAELTSEDEWIGSGDEDEGGLDRMEREEGDDETFNQDKLQRELGQIHMRDVLDTDKREVRIIQELLFEDGDLGGGHRQRKFRWRDGGGEELNGTVPDEFADTQEDDCESEEQWRKQRHEREVFLKQMQQQDTSEDITNVKLNRTSMIKASLMATSSSFLEITASSSEKTDESIATSKKSVKDIPSPKKSFTLIQKNYHGSLLTRGRGALVRLAALATPLVTDDESTNRIGTTSKRNFVFTTLTQEEEPSKAPKRKADTISGTPQLIKKLRVDDKKNRKSLLDHL